MLRTNAIWLLISAAAAAQVRPADLLKSVPAPDHRLAYGSDPLEFGELRLPRSKGPFSIVVLVHGGCWMDHLAGLDPRATTFELLRPLAAALASAGIATWNVEYRRSGSPGGGWPASYLDLGAAVDYLRKIAPVYGLDLARMIVAGHSSGGQLALWIAARPRLPVASPLYRKDALKVKAAIDVDGPPDLAAYQPFERSFCGVAGITEFMGGTPAERPERYREGSGQTFLPLGVPQEIVAAGLLAAQPQLVRAYEALARAKGDGITVLNLSGSGHFDMLSPDSPQGKALIQVISKLAN